MLRLLRYFAGYVLIKICGDDSEQFLNRIINHGIKIWNLHYKNGCIYGCVASESFIKLFTVRHKLNCKIKIVKKHGLFIKYKNYSKRFGLFAGAITFMAILLVLNNYVWVINIEGNSVIKTQEIIDICDTFGIKEGITKRKVKNKYDAQKLMLAHKEIAWCSFNLEGCVLNINISEIAFCDNDTRKNPSNIKAKTAGKIKKIDAVAGDVLVKIGDYVAENDLLVSGVIQNNSGTHLVYADATIIAETKRVFSASGDFSQSVLMPTNTIKKHHSIQLFNVRVPLYLNNVKGEFEYKKDINHLNLFNKKIPITITTEKYEIFCRTQITYTTEQLESILYKNIENQLNNFNFITINETSKELIKTDKGLLLNITYSCEENISFNDTILLSKVN